MLYFLTYSHRAILVQVIMPRDSASGKRHVGEDGINASGPPSKAAKPDPGTLFLQKLGKKVANKIKITSYNSDKHHALNFEEMVETCYKQKLPAVTNK